MIDIINRPLAKLSKEKEIIKITKNRTKRASLLTLQE